MLKSEVDEHLDRWYFGQRVYIMKELGAPLGFYIIFIDKITINLFRCLPESEYQLGDLTKEELSKLLISNQLKFYEERSNFVNYKQHLKTHGCECGAFITRNPNMHATWCSKYKDWRKS